MLGFILLLSGCGNAAIVETKSETIQTNETGNVTETQSDIDVDDESESVVHETLSGNIGDVVEITEKLFIARTNDIYINTEDYLGKTIKYEGIFMSDYWEDTDTTYRYVIRYGPGCCGYDSNAGFEVVWDGDYPEENDWVEAVGVLEIYEEDGDEYLQLQLTALTVLDERGEEYVSN